jgi:hypothetical protein
MLHTPSNALGSVVPLYAAGNNSGGSPFGFFDRYGPKVIVGNSGAGDTIAVCNYLDVGDGVQLQAALTAAAAFNGDVHVRSGTYVISTPLDIPDNVTMHGAGAATVLAASATNRTVIDSRENCVIERLAIQASIPTGVPVGDALVQLGSNNQLRNCTVTLASLTALQQATETLRYAVRLQSTSGRLINVQITIPYSRLIDASGGTMTGVQMEGAYDCQLEHCLVRGGDVGYELSGRVDAIGCQAVSIAQVGVLMQTSVLDGIYAPSWIGGLIDFATQNIYGVMADVSGAYVRTGGFVTGLFGARIIGTTFLAPAGLDATATGIELDEIGEGFVAQGNTFDKFPIGISGTATQDYANVIGNITRGATTSIALLGVNCNSAENVAVP